MERKSQDVNKQHTAALAARDLLLVTHIFKNSKNIACYFAMNHEFSLNPLIDVLLNSNKKCYLPKINNSHLDFFLYSKNISLKRNKFNILEPETQHAIQKNDLDLVLLPLVGFDLRGNRLGMGGGFYDKSFDFMLHSKTQKPFLLGVGFECQKCSKIPIEEFDVRLHGVLTEKDIYYFV